MRTQHCGTRHLRLLATKDSGAWYVLSNFGQKQYHCCASDRMRAVSVLQCSLQHDGAGRSITGDLGAWYVLSNFGQKPYHCCASDRMRAVSVLQCSLQHDGAGRSITGDTTCVDVVAGTPRATEADEAGAVRGTAGETSTAQTRTRPQHLSAFGTAKPCAGTVPMSR